MTAPSNIHPQSYYNEKQREQIAQAIGRVNTTVVPCVGGLSNAHIIIYRCDFGYGYCTLRFSASGKNWPGDYMFHREHTYSYASMIKNPSFLDDKSQEFIDFCRRMFGQMDEALSGPCRELFIELLDEIDGLNEEITDLTQA